MASQIWKDNIPPDYSCSVTADGRIFFINESTRESSWLHPLTKAPVQTGHTVKKDLPLGWEKGVTFRGLIYYVDHNNQRTTLDHPNEHILERFVHAPSPQIVTREEKTGSPLSNIISGSNHETKRQSTKKASLGLRVKGRGVKRPETSSNTLQGWLQKQGLDGLQLWKRRWFVLSEFCLYYYKSPQEDKVLGYIPLPSFKIRPTTPDDKISKRFSFKLEHENTRTYFFAADSKSQMTQWMNALSLASILQKDESFADNFCNGQVENNIYVSAAKNYHTNYLTPDSQRIPSQITENGRFSPLPKFQDYKPFHNKNSFGLINSNRNNLNSPIPDLYLELDDSYSCQTKDICSRSRSFEHAELSCFDHRSVNYDQNLESCANYRVNELSKSRTNTILPDYSVDENSESSRLTDRSSLDSSQNRFGHCQPFYANAPPKPKRLNTSYESKSSKSDKNVYTCTPNKQQCQRNNLIRVQNNSAEQQTPEAYGTTLSVFNKEYDDVYKETCESTLNSQVTSPFGCSFNSSKSDAAHSEDLNTSVHSYDRISSNFSFKLENILPKNWNIFNTSSKSPVRPRSADFLEYDRRHGPLKMQSKQYTNGSNITARTRPKSSIGYHRELDFCQESDFWSEENYAAKMRQSSIYKSLKNSSKKKSHSQNIGHNFRSDTSHQRNDIAGTQNPNVVSIDSHSNYKDSNNSNEHSIKSSCERGINSLNEPLVKSTYGSGINPLNEYSIDSFKEANDSNGYITNPNEHLVKSPYTPNESFVKSPHQHNSITSVNEHAVEYSYVIKDKSKHSNKYLYTESNHSNVYSGKSPCKGIKSSNEHSTKPLHTDINDSNEHSANLSCSFKKGNSSNKYSNSSYEVNLPILSPAVEKTRGRNNTPVNTQSPCTHSNTGSLKRSLNNLQNEDSLRSQEAKCYQNSANPFLRSSSARLSKISYNGSNCSSQDSIGNDKKMEHKGESLQRLLEWKQRMLRSPLTRKSNFASSCPVSRPNSSASSCSSNNRTEAARNFDTDSYRKQILKQLASQEMLGRIHHDNQQHKNSQNNITDALSNLNVEHNNKEHIGKKSSNSIPTTQKYSYQDCDENRSAAKILNRKWKKSSKRNNHLEFYIKSYEKTNQVKFNANLSDEPDLDKNISHEYANLDDVDTKSSIYNRSGAINNFNKKIDNRDAICSNYNDINAVSDILFPDNKVYAEEKKFNTMLNLTQRSTLNRPNSNVNSLSNRPHSVPNVIDDSSLGKYSDSGYDSFKYNFVQTCKDDNIESNSHKRDITYEIDTKEKCAEKQNHNVLKECKSDYVTSPVSDNTTINFKKFYDSNMTQSDLATLESPRIVQETQHASSKSSIMDKIKCFSVSKEENCNDLFKSEGSEVLNKVVLRTIVPKSLAIHSSQAHVSKIKASYASPLSSKSNFKTSNVTDISLNKSAKNVAMGADSGISNETNDLSNSQKIVNSRKSCTSNIRNFVFEDHFDNSKSSNEEVCDKNMSEIPDKIKMEKNKQSVKDILESFEHKLKNAKIKDPVSEIRTRKFYSDSELLSNESSSNESEDWDYANLGALKYISDESRRKFNGNNNIGSSVPPPRPPKNPRLKSTLTDYDDKSYDKILSESIDESLRLLSDNDNENFYDNIIKNKDIPARYVTDNQDFSKDFASLDGPPKTFAPPPPTSASPSIQNVEEHYLPMSTPKKNVKEFSNVKNFSSTCLQGKFFKVPEGVLGNFEEHDSEEHTYIEMTGVVSLNASYSQIKLEPPKIELENVNENVNVSVESPSYCEISDKDSQLYEYICKTSSNYEPIYAELPIKKQMIDDGETLQSSGERRKLKPFHKKSSSDSALGLIYKCKNDIGSEYSSDADDEASKDLLSLETSKKPRFSLSDTFRPASYYLSPVGSYDDFDNRDSSDSDLVSPPPIPTNISGSEDFGLPDPLMNRNSKTILTNANEAVSNSLEVFTSKNKVYDSLALTTSPNKMKRRPIIRKILSENIEECDDFILRSEDVYPNSFSFVEEKDPLSDVPQWAYKRSSKEFANDITGHAKIEENDNCSNVVKATIFKDRNDTQSDIYYQNQLEAQKKIYKSESTPEKSRRTYSSKNSLDQSGYKTLTDISDPISRKVLNNNFGINNTINSKLSDVFSQSTLKSPQNDIGIPTCSDNSLVGYRSRTISDLSNHNNNHTPRVSLRTELSANSITPIHVRETSNASLTNSECSPRLAPYYYSDVINNVDSVNNGRPKSKKYQLNNQVEVGERKKLEIGKKVNSIFSHEAVESEDSSLNNGRKSFGTFQKMNTPHTINLYKKDSKNLREKMRSKTPDPSLRSKTVITEINSADSVNRYSKRKCHKRSKSLEGLVAPTSEGNNSSIIESLIQSNEFELNLKSGHANLGENKNAKSEYTYFSNSSYKSASNDIGLPVPYETNKSDYLPNYFRNNVISSREKAVATPYLTNANEVRDLNYKSDSFNDHTPRHAELVDKDSLLSKETNESRGNNSLLINKMSESSKWEDDGEWKEQLRMASLRHTKSLENLDEQKPNESPKQYRTVYEKESSQKSTSQYVKAITNQDSCSYNSSYGNTINSNCYSSKLTDYTNRNLPKTPHQIYEKFESQKPKALTSLDEYEWDETEEKFTKPVATADKVQSSFLFNGLPHLKENLSEKKLMRKIETSDEYNNMQCAKNVKSVGRPKSGKILQKKYDENATEKAKHQRPKNVEAISEKNAIGTVSPKSPPDVIPKQDASNIGDRFNRRSDRRPCHRISKCTQGESPMSSYSYGFGNGHSGYRQSQGRETQSYRPASYDYYTLKRLKENENQSNLYSNQPRSSNYPDMDRNYLSNLTYENYSMYPPYSPIRRTNESLYGAGPPQNTYGYGYGTVAGELYDAFTEVEILKEEELMLQRETNLNAYRHPSVILTKPVSIHNPFSTLPTSFAAGNRLPTLPEHFSGSQAFVPGDVSAGELLGKTHEELVLLLIQLRRHQSALLDARKHASIEKENKIRMAQLDSEHGKEYLNEISQLEEHLQDLERQHQMGKPLINLVDNMVKLGTLYPNVDARLSVGQHENPLLANQPRQDAIDFSRRIMEKRILAEDKIEYDAIVPNQVDLEEKVLELYKLDRRLQLESRTIQTLLKHKDILERRLENIHYRAQSSNDSALQLERDGFHRDSMERELSRLQTQLAVSSMRLEETATENNRLEHEMMLLRQKIQLNMQRNAHRNTPGASEARHIESEMLRVQSLLENLQKKRKELSKQIHTLTSNNRNTNEAKRNLRFPTQSTKKISGWSETDLDTMKTEEASDQSPQLKNPFVGSSENLQSITDASSISRHATNPFLEANVDEVPILTISKATTFDSNIAEDAYMSPEDTVRSQRKNKNVKRDYSSPSIFRNADESSNFHSYSQSHSRNTDKNYSQSHSRNADENYSQSPNLYSYSQSHSQNTDRNYSQSHLLTADENYSQSHSRNADEHHSSRSSSDSNSRTPQSDIADRNATAANRIAVGDPLEEDCMLSPFGLDINDADDRMKRFYGILPKEKLEPKTVRIVKRESTERKKANFQPGRNEDDFPQRDEDYFQQNQDNFQRRDDNFQRQDDNFQRDEIFLQRNEKDFQRTRDAFEHYDNNSYDRDYENLDSNYDNDPYRVEKDTFRTSKNGVFRSQNKEDSYRSTKNAHYRSSEENLEKYPAKQNENYDCSPQHRSSSGDVLYYEQEEEYRSEAHRRPSDLPLKPKSSGLRSKTELEDISTLSAHERLFGFPKPQSINHYLPSPKSENLRSPVFKSDAAREILKELNSDTENHRRTSPKEKRRHHTISSSKPVSLEHPTSVASPVEKPRSRDDCDMARALRHSSRESHPPDVVKSTLSSNDVRYNESTIDTILGAPKKISIPERYTHDQEEEVELSQEERIHRETKAAAIKKMLTDSSAAMTKADELDPDFENLNPDLDDPNSFTGTSQRASDRKERERMLEMNQILAKQVMQKSRVVAARANAARRCSSPSSSSSCEEEIRSGDSTPDLL